MVAQLEEGGTDGQLLLVEDDAPLAATMVSSFRRQGWRVVLARDGREALTAFHSAMFTIVIIDWELPPPGPSGIELCEQMRLASPAVGLVFVTAREALGDRLLAFKAGADDYIVKPFVRDELMARIAAVMRRTERPSRVAAVAAIGAWGPECPPTADQRYLTCDCLTVDMATLRVIVGQNEIDLSLRQLLILIYLLRCRGRLVPEAELRERVLRTGSLVPTSTMRNHIHQLRAKLGPAKHLLRSVHGKGYGIGTPEDWSQESDASP